MDFQPTWRDIPEESSRGKYKKVIMAFLESGHVAWKCESTEEKVHLDYGGLKMCVRVTRPKLPVKVSRRGLTIFLIRTDLDLGEDDPVADMGFVPTDERPS